MLVCFQADNVVTVPLVGWGKGDVETIVEGLSTGDWTSFTQLTEG